MSSDYEIYKEKMRKTIDAVLSQFASVRAGRANPAVLDKITIEYYGAPTPIHSLRHMPLRTRALTNPALGRILF